MVELGDILYQSSAQWIQMDVSNQLQQIGVLLADHGLVPILEQMARPFVPEVEVDGIPGEQPAHERRKTGLARPKQEVKMVAH